MKVNYYSESILTPIIVLMIKINLEIENNPKKRL